MSCFFFGLSILLCRRQTVRADAKTHESTVDVEIGTMPGGPHDAIDDHSKGAKSAAKMGRSPVREKIDSKKTEAAQEPGPRGTTL